MHDFRLAVLFLQAQLQALLHLDRLRRRPRHHATPRFIAAHLSEALERTKLLCAFASAFVSHTHTSTSIERVLLLFHLLLRLSAVPTSIALAAAARATTGVVARARAVLRETA